MSPEFLAQYDSELAYLREKASELTHYRPNTASMLGLGMGQSKARDSQVERLLEGVAFLAARVQTQIRAGYPLIAQALLESVFPSFNAPFPACAMVQFQPLPTLVEDYPVPRGTELVINAGRNSGTEDDHDYAECRFQTAQSLTVLPLTIEDASYFIGTPEYFRDHSGIKSCLRLKFRHTKGGPINSLKGFQDIVVYITGHGGSASAAKIYELICNNHSGVAFSPTGDDLSGSMLPIRIAPIGFAENEGLLPEDCGGFQGFQTLKEFLAFPARFMFVRLSGFESAIRRCSAPDFEIWIGMTGAHPELQAVINPRSFALNCVPAINLFRESTLVNVNIHNEEFEVIGIPDRRLDTEVFRIESVSGNEIGRSAVHSFFPFHFAPSSVDEGQRYFSVRRSRRSLLPEEIQSRTAPSYLGSEVYLMLVDAQAPPISPLLKSVRVSALFTNRHLPLRIRPGARALSPLGCPAQPVFLSESSEPIEAPTSGDLVWRLISHLSMNYFTAIGGNPDGSNRDAKVLREWLRVYADVFSASPQGARLSETTLHRINAIRTVRAERNWSVISERGEAGLVRGLKITLGMKEEPLVEVGAYLFGSVLEHVMGRFANINSFVQLVLETDRRGKVAQWNRKPGQRNIV